MLLPGREIDVASVCQRRDEIIAGYRGNGGSVLIYRADAQGAWSKTVLDNAIPANACAVADLNADGRPDLVCIGGALLKWYGNLP